MASCGTSGNGGGGRIFIYYKQANNWSGNTLDASHAVAVGTGGQGGANGTIQISLLPSSVKIQGGTLLRGGAKLKGT